MTATEKRQHDYRIAQLAKIFRKGNFFEEDKSLNIPALLAINQVLTEIYATLSSDDKDYLYSTYQIYGKSTMYRNAVQGMQNYYVDIFTEEEVIL